MIAIDLTKRIRSLPWVNSLVRRGLRGVLGGAHRVERLTQRWRVSGTPTVRIAGASFRMLGCEDDHMLDALYYGRGWESGETRLFAILISQARVALDLGANTGVYSLIATQISPTVRVFAVEPSPANVARLRTNLRLNSETRVAAVEVAVGAAEGTLDFTVPADGSLSDVASAVDAFSRSHYGIKYTTILVTQTTVDRLVDDHGLDRIDLIKLDVEYFELDVLQGAGTTLTRFGPVVLAEVFDYDVLVGDKPELQDRIAPDSSAQVEAFMSSHGYTFFAIGKLGVLRVDTLRGRPDGGSNYMFVKHPVDRRYIPYTDAAAIRALMSRPGQP